MPLFLPVTREDREVQNSSKECRSSAPIRLGWGDRPSANTSTNDNSSPVAAPKAACRIRLWPRQSGPELLVASLKPQVSSPSKICQFNNGIILNSETVHCS